MEIDEIVYDWLDMDQNKETEGMRTRHVGGGQKNERKDELQNNRENINVY